MVFPCPLGWFHPPVGLFTSQLFAEHLPRARPCLGTKEAPVLGTDCPGTPGACALSLSPARVLLPCLWLALLCWPLKP